MSMRTAPGAFFVACVIALSSCAVEPEPVVDQVVEVTAEEEAIELEAPRHPLTGFEIGTSEISGPSVAVKIDNTSSGRPQVGIAAADIVFEELVEGARDG